MNDQALAAIALWVSIIVIPVSVVVRSHMLRKRDEFAAEHYRRFVQPRIDRGLAAGISYERLMEIWQEVKAENVDPTIVGGAPGSRFDRLIDREIEKQNKG